MCRKPEVLNKAVTVSVHTLMKKKSGKNDDDDEAQRDGWPQHTS